MRRDLIAGALLIALSTSGGASFKNREWGACAVAGVRPLFAGTKRSTPLKRIFAVTMR